MGVKKKALITGISGQDGSYLSELLLELGYEVLGIIRRHSVSESQDSRIAHLGDQITTHYGDVLDQASLNKIFKEVQPDEIYNLAAQSHVRVSSDIPVNTFQTNALGTLHVLEAFKNECPNAKLYQASSSEMFGSSVDEDMFQRETTPMHPVSPYGCSKVAAYHLVRHYRKAYKLHASNGILFNHESIRRGENFVTNKVVKSAVMIRMGMIEKLELGNIDSYRDWGHSKDYVKAMQLILQQPNALDGVISSMSTYSVRDMCQYVFNVLGMDYKEYITQNVKYLRPEELPYLRGDSSMLRELLQWVPEYTFHSMLDEMISYWIEQLDPRYNEK